MEHKATKKNLLRKPSALILSWQSYWVDNRDHYIMLQTSWLQNSTSDYDRQFSNQCDRCKMLKVVHGNQSDNYCKCNLSWRHTQLSIPLIYIYGIQYYSSTRKHPVLPSLSSMHTHNMHSLVLCFKTVAFVFENKSNKITTDSLPIADFLPV